MGKEKGEPVFAHNLCGNPFGRREDIVREFELNAGKLRSRKNGNTLYHEVISLEAGSNLQREEMIRILGEIGQEYAKRRAPNQIAFGMVHATAKHIHLHICMSANALGKDRPERLSREAFANVQKDMERLVLERYEKLAQRPVYTKDKSKECLKTTKNEQEMCNRTGEPSKKEDIKTKLHQFFERAQTPEELVATLKAQGFAFYQRGKTVGIIDKATNRRHRLSTLGITDHYETTIVRLFEPGKAPESERRTRASRAERNTQKTAEASQKPDLAADPRDQEHEKLRDEPKHEDEREAPTHDPKPAQGRESEPEADIKREQSQTPEDRRRNELLDIFRGKDRNINLER
jgi:hypothetical protein